ncbi:hypothetical protein B0H14DRAFT_1516155 [Mycena olivaceomarginata]|nr:hypothetical protein B0H14DRAFT_1516155 [Mycena olivaceomarginata]
MPTSSPATVDRILDYTGVAVDALHDVATASHIPFLGRVCALTLTIIAMVKNVKFQRERCLRIVEEIHHSLCALTVLAIHSDDIQAPKMLDHIAQYADTLQKFDSCLRSQRELGTIKRLFKQGEIAVQLDSCETELRALLAVFTAKQGAGLASALVEFNLDTETRHQELLEIISSKSSSFDAVSSIGRSVLNASSGSFSLLPACPKIFHGRESELEDLVCALLVDPARVAILGPGGMGKTTLAIAALHHPNVANKYQTRHFISCESAHTRDSLVATIVSHLDLNTSRTSERAVVALLSAGQPCLLILDNFETPWEALESRERVEEFLALLADIPHLALLVTMRGAERPSRVQWTHPFLRPLIPLDQAAARQAFIDIADEIHDSSEVDQLLEITDNIPLAVQLVAGVAASVGCQDTIERWNLERTALLSAGYDKRSNLEISITLSLLSPRMLSSPHAAELLSLMSLLSDGLSNLDLVQSNIPIQDILNCKTTLVRTSLAYIDHAGQFKVLAPIREYIRLARPPTLQSVRPLRRYLLDLLKLYMSRSFGVDLVPRLVSNLGNLHGVLQQGLYSHDIDLRESILGIIIFNNLNLAMNRGLTPLMLRLPEILSRMNDHELHGRFITSAIEASHFYTLPNLEMAIDEAIEHFRLIQDRDGEGRLYSVIGFHFEWAHDLEKAEDFYLLALSVASQCHSDTNKIKPLGGLAQIQLNRGNYSEALQLAQEAYRMARVLGNIGNELNGIRLQAQCYSLLGHLNRSMQFVDDGKDLVVRAGLQGGQMENLLMNIEAHVHQVKTEYSEARHIQEAILHQTSAVLSTVMHASALLNIAFLDVVTGISADAVSRNLNAAMTLFQNARVPRGISLCQHCHADLLLREGDKMTARDEYMRLLATARGSDDEIACYCLARLADPANPVHADTECGRWAVVFLAYTLRPQVRSQLMVHQALRCLGDVLVGQGVNDTALSVLSLALEGFTQMDVHQSRAECMRTMGDVYLRRGDLFRVREMWEVSRLLFERSEQQKEVAKIDKKLQKLSVAQKLETIPQVHTTLQDSGMNSKPILIPNL